MVLCRRPHKREWNGTCQPPLSRYNELSSSFGYPITVNTNLDRAASLRVRSDVLLTNGVVRLALEHATGSFGVWLPEWYDNNGNRHAPEQALDAETRTERYFTMAEWRNVLRRYGTSSHELNLQLTSSATGRVDLVVEYVNAADGTRLHDYARQRVTAINPILLADLDRDGRIDASDVRQLVDGRIFRYWINQCRIDGNVWSEPSLYESIAGALSNPENSADDEVNGRYDLVNFFPVAVDLEAFAAHWSDAGFSCRIYDAYHDDGYNYVMLNRDWRDAGSIQTQDCETVSHEMLHEAHVSTLDAEGKAIAAGEYQTAYSETSCTMVLEARRRGWGLWADIRVGSDVLMTFRLPMSISPVDDMFRFVSIRDGLDNPDMAFAGTGSPANCPDGEMKDQDVFFMHGFNVSADGARNWNREIFKRLWLSGSRARYWGVTWPGDYHVTGETFNGLHYQRDVRQAMTCAPVLARLVNTCGTNAVVLGHSLGNMITSEALLRGANARTYFMLDAAVASEAYRGSLQASSDELLSKYRPSDWAGYDARSWAANWYAWFVENEGDDRKDLGWVNHFAPLLTNDNLNVYNFYSSGDEVFAESDTVPWLASGVFHWPTLDLTWPFVHLNLELDAYPWQKQETFKGVNPVGGSMLAGWGFHCIEDPTSDSGYRIYTTQEVAAMVADGSVTNNAVFNRDVSAMFQTTISDFDKADILASHIPAISSPAGKVPVIGRDGQDVNMNTEFRNSGWGRDPDEQTRATPWLHSDIKNMAYRYVYGVFMKIVELGGLR